MVASLCDVYVDEMLLFFFFLFPLSVSLVPGVPRHNNNNSTGMLTYSFFLFDSAHAGCATRLNRPWQVRGNGRH